MNEIETLRERLDRGEITCETVITFLLEYLASELPAERERAFARHLERCPSCVAYLDGYRATIALAREAQREGDEGAPALPPDLAAAILASRH